MKSALVVESPLAELVDWTIRLHAHQDLPCHAVIDQKLRPFFETVRASLAQTMQRLQQIEYVRQTTNAMLTTTPAVSAFLDFIRRC
ncbi:hypothetical protein MASSI9I_20490 [Massilia sp. 9I]|nr:hypothetical protein MASSI9I_20490 [Massilia sp. 9I]